MTTSWIILVVSSHLENRRALIRILDGLPADVIASSTLSQARDVLARQEVHLVFCDDSLPDGTYRSAGKRLPFYETALRAIPDHLLLGRGIGSWGPFQFGADARNYPHDLFLELLFEEGLLGLTAFLSVLLSLAISIVWMLKASRFHFLAVPLLLFYAVNVSMFSGDLDDNRLIWLWAGMTLAICRVVELDRRQRSRVPAQRVILPARLRPAPIFVRSRDAATPTPEKVGGAAWR